MSKCYLIGCRLQQRVVDRVMHRSCHIQPMQRQTDMCNVHIRCPEVGRGSASMSAHDEFSGAPKVSLLDRAVMTTGLDRLRRTAAPRGIALLRDAADRREPGDRSRRGVALGRRCAQRHPPDRGHRRRPARPRPCAPASRSGSSRAGTPIGAIPGDAGVPPRFDFAGSQNVKAVEVLWPAPQRIPEESLVAIGYTGDVILPLAIVPQNAAKPVRAASQARLCGVREAVRAGRGQGRAAAHRRPLIPGCRARGGRSADTAEGRPRARHRARHQIGAARGWRRPAAHHCRRRCAARHHCRPVRRGARAGLGAAGARARSKARRRACNASRSNSTVRRPGPNTTVRRHHPHGGRGGCRHRGRDPSRLIRRAR